MKVAVISDLHTSSSHSKLISLIKFIRRCISDGIRHFIVVGDLIDGDYSFRKAHFSQDVHGFDNQVKHLGEIVNGAIGKKLIRDKKVVIYFITGNHENNFEKQIGMQAGPKMVAELGDHWKFLGKGGGEVTFNGHRVKLLHPVGKCQSARSISHNGQKLVDNFDMGEAYDLVVIGHFHRMDLCYYKGGYILQPGCWQSGNDEYNHLMKPPIGGCVVEFKKNSNSLPVTFYRY